jgi:hypothetical protein
MIVVGTSTPASCFGQRIAIPEQQAHGQERVMDAADRGEVGERRAQDEARGRVLGCQLGHHGRTEALAEVQEPIRPHAGLLGQEPVGGADVAGKAALRRAPAVGAVAAIVEEQDAEAIASKRGR